MVEGFVYSPCQFFLGSVHPGKLTWNLKMNPWKRRFRFLLETINFRFHVSFRGGRYDVFFHQLQIIQHPGIQAPVPLKAPPNIFGLICPYHQFPTKATWLVHLHKKNITLKSHILKVSNKLGDHQLATEMPRIKPHK